MATSKEAAAIGLRIKMAREARGMTQEQLAGAADIRTEQINRWERGHRAASPKSIRKIAEALGVSSAELQFGEAPSTQVAILPPTAAYKEFLATSLGRELAEGRRLGREADRSILVALRSVRWGDISPTVAMLETIAREELWRRRDRQGGVPVSSDPPPHAHQKGAGKS